MGKGLMLAGEPMGLLIAQSEGSLDSVEGYSLAVAGAEFNVATGSAIGHRARWILPPKSVLQPRRSYSR